MESPTEGRGRGLAEQLIKAMRTIGERQGLTHLIAPVRPSLKERYPLAAIESYVRCRGVTGSCSIRGCECTSVLTRAWPPRFPGRCGSPER